MMKESITGGKAQNLIIMQKAGYPVPEFIVLNAADIETDLSKVVFELRQRFQNDTLFAVRSSASVEDSIQHSFAGQFRSFLNVPITDLEEKIKAVYASRLEEHIQHYQQNNSARQPIEMFVIVQRMVCATKGGVAFGANPLNKSNNEKVISIVEGLADDLVNGNVTGEQYLINQGKIIERGILLSDDEINLICQTLDDLKSLFHQIPQDIEFAFEGDKFYLLQSRPITTLSLDEEEEIIWDNSNIVESYPGQTLPLTFSFIEKMYEAVYRQFSLVLGISKGKVEANAATFKNMLGLLNGRVYYNLNSWFRSLALLPGYALNADFMQKMMGVREKIDVDFSEKRKGNLLEYLSVVKAIIGLVASRVNARRGAKKFIAGFEEVYGKFDQKIFTSTSISQIIEDYKSFEQLMVQRWKAPLVNDLFAMIYFGLLQKMTTGIKADLHNNLIAGSEDIITTEPMKWLPKLAKQIADHPELHQLFMQQNPATIWLQMNNGNYTKELESINQYIKRWGDRSLAELKLETITYRQRPELLIGILQNYVAQKIFTYNEGIETQLERKEAEQEVKKALQGQWLKKLLFKHVLSSARYFVSNRENLRYYRTKAFGMVRRMMLAIDAQLLNSNIIEHKNDIFYLKMEEVMQSGQIPDSKDFKTLIASRKTEYLFFEQNPLPQRLTTKGKRNIILNVHPEALPINNHTILKGTACSAGVVSAKVRLVKDLSEAKTLQQSILATYSTDPGWVVLFPSCAGILTERGSMLSHAAIVSREMGIPCIVGLEHLMTVLKDGDEIVMDGTTGVVNIISSDT